MRMVRADALRGSGLVAVLLALVGTLTASASQPVAVSPPVSGPAVPLAVDSFRSSRSYSAVAPPVRLRIPDLGIDTSLGRLGRNRDGTVAVPADPAQAGWYAEGARPGQPGPAVILGHVDSTDGPGVFYDLTRLRAGTRVSVDRADGTRVEFRVTGQRQVAKTRFPTDLVYSPTLEPSLRLVTCGGTFDRTVGHYRDNVIVFADAP
ncbi:class F sortase [Asanoa sp. WMMD1127]|uniref:class F sortase n=1 Tax=Asanoa sp. WMMD1127 TaxID=3016107 RepID=UPI002417C9D2|nr:class F sortase [Asanoa sp. WMMD1127]MDG4822956.1 class F sortase [Asanoa sp. WMMD1127]